MLQRLSYLALLSVCLTLTACADGEALFDMAGNGSSPNAPTENNPLAIPPDLSTLTPQGIYASSVAVSNQAENARIGAVTPALVEKKLQELEVLYQKKLITEEEYQTKRTALLKQL